MKQAVIVGAGAAGLTAAILLGARGWRVTVLEQHYRPGGCLHRFFRRGVGYDTGFHYVGSAKPGQSFGQVVRHLGIAPHLAFESLDPEGFDTLRFPGLEFRVPAGLDRWAGRLAAMFPGDAAGLSRYTELHRACVASYGLYSLDADVPPEAVLPWEERTLANVLASELIDPRLRALIAGHGAPLYGVAPHEAPFGLHALVTDHFLGGAYTIRGGGDRLAQVMVARVEALGGRVRLRAPAAQIRVEGGVATGVELDDGEVVGGDLVIGAIHPRAVLALLPPGAVRPAYRERVELARPGRVHMGVYLEVEGDLSPLAGRNLYRYHTWDVDGVERLDDAEVPFWFLTAPGARGEGRGVVLGLFPTSAARWAGWEGEERGRRPGGAPHRPPEYEREKARMLDGFLRRLAVDYPDWRVVRAEASSPLTMRHYTRVPFGATYGHHHAVDQMGRYRLPMVTRVRQLVQIGQAVAMPGICGAMMSAYVGVAGLVGMPQMIEELRAA
ncbi:phytoene dehydrogenase [Deltaproteobacteria bacterium]|nr:phytoene dehydrogenase [Deltaproteobacteria bacterium]